MVLQLDVEVGSSTVARGVINLVLGYLNNLVIEMAFLVQVTTTFKQTFKSDLPTVMTFSHIVLSTINFAGGHSRRAPRTLVGNVSA